MGSAVAQTFLHAHNHAILTTWRRDGRLHVSPVAVDLTAAGWAIICSRATADTVRHLRRDPRAALCVFVESFPGL